MKGDIMKKYCKRQLVENLQNLNGLWFHLIGLACLIWFMIRVLPAPHRSQYPCQQIAMPVAFGYLAFWSILFCGLSRWIRKAKWKTTATLPAILVALIIGFSISGAVFADSYQNTPVSFEPWDPIPNEPIGVPKGIHPGRVTWVWNPDATEKELQGYWWLKQNNNQAVIDQMVSTGVCGLTGITDDAGAWEALFMYFNEMHGNGDVGYQPGEKIAIKINLNNCYAYFLQNPYTRKDNDRDASPYVIKAILRQLVNTVGVAQEDITVFDSSRKMPNWFYHRVYYETYPAFPVIPEFSQVHFVDMAGEATGRESVEPSSEKIYFADDSGLWRTLPTCVSEATYLINVPLLKKHPINNGITLSAKNLFGSWIEEVADVHPYHEAGFISGNPTPQTDLIAHEQLGGKTLLYVGDGTFGTLEDHKTIAKFQSYPFNNDWSNSLFFSQDPVAIDSVMHDFLFAENPPVEGAHNYLHQSAEPLPDTYDPEHDGVYLSESLGVHEHWDPTEHIFSPDRYVGSSGNGIDFIAYGEEYASPAVFITNPKEHRLYMMGNELVTFPVTFIIGSIEVNAQVNGVEDAINKVEFYLDGKLQHTDYEEPYAWLWNTSAYFRHSLTTVAYCDDQYLSQSVNVWKFM